MRLAHRLPQDPALLAAALCYLGIGRERMGDATASSGAFRQALDVAEPFGDAHRLAAWYLEQATTAAREGHFQEAKVWAEKAMALHEAAGYKRRLAEIRLRLGAADLQAGRWEEARTHYWWSVALRGAVGDARGAAQILACLVEALLARVSPEAARVVADAALALLPEPRGRLERAQVLHLRGTIYRLLRRFGDARAALVESLQIFEELQRATDIRFVSHELALLMIETSDIPESHRLREPEESPAALDASATV